MMRHVRTPRPRLCELEVCKREFLPTSKHRRYCSRACANRARAEYQDWREHHLQQKYGITPEEYERMLGAQGGVCAICEKPPGKQRLHVDHDHRTEIVRGLLCYRCNSALSMVDVAGLEKVRSYLQAVGARK